MKDVRRFLPILPAILLCCLALQCVHGRQLIVAKSGATYRTIQSAINAARRGDTIVVEAGTYQERITLKCEVTLQGAGKDHTILTYGGRDPVVTANGVSSGVMTGFTVRYTGSANPSVIDIDSSNVTISGCEIIGGGYHGIVISGTSTVNVSNCSIHGNGQNGVVAWGGRVTVTGSDIAENEYNGVAATQGADVTIEDCTLHHNLRTGFHYDNRAKGSALDNDVFQNTSGAAIIQRADPVIEQNTFRENEKFGIIIQDQGRGSVLRNTFYGNGSSGILVKGDSSTSIEYNTLVDNDENGLFILEGSAPKIIGNIIAYNGETGIDTTNPGYADGKPDSISHNNIWGNRSGDYDGIPKPPSDISADPQFVDFEGRDFRLKSPSSSLTAGEGGKPIGAEQVALVAGSPAGRAVAGDAPATFEPTPQVVGYDVCELLRAADEGPQPATSESTEPEPAPYYRVRYGPFSELEDGVSIRVTLGGPFSESHKITWEWYDPSGKLHHTHTNTLSTAAIEDREYRDSYVTVFSTFLFGNLPATNRLGAWKVRVLVDGKLGHSGTFLIEPKAVEKAAEPLREAEKTPGTEAPLQDEVGQPDTVSVRESDPKPGGSGDDVIRGGDGNDTLRGGEGIDTLKTSGEAEPTTEPTSDAARSEIWRGCEINTESISYPEVIRLYYDCTGEHDTVVRTVNYGDDPTILRIVAMSSSGSVLYEDYNAVGPKEAKEYSLRVLIERKGQSLETARGLCVIDELKGGIPMFNCERYFDGKLYDAESLFSFIPETAELIDTFAALEVRTTRPIHTWVQGYLVHICNPSARDEAPQADNESTPSAPCDQSRDEGFAVVNCTSESITYLLEVCDLDGQPVLCSNYSLDPLASDYHQVSNILQDAGVSSYQWDGLVRIARLSPGASWADETGASVSSAIGVAHILYSELTPCAAGFAGLLFNARPALSWRE